MTVIAVAFFALCLRRLGSQWALGALAFHFYTDHLHQQHERDRLHVGAGLSARRPLPGAGGPGGFAGVMLRLAIGCRITSGAALLPLVLCYQAERQDRVRKIVQFSLTACLAGAICFAPVWLVYGWSWLTFYEEYQPTLASVLKQFTIDVWGITGVIGWVMAAGLLLVNHVRGQRQERTAGDTRLQIALGLAVVIYVLAYVRLPHQAGYLVPGCAFALLLLASTVRPGLFVLVCCALLLAPAVTITRSGLHAGPIVRDYQARVAMAGIARQVLEKGRQLPESGVIVSGHLLPVLQVLIDPTSKDRDRYVWLLSEAKQEKYQILGYHVYYVPGQREFNAQIYKFDLAAHGASPLPLD